MDINFDMMVYSYVQKGKDGQTLKLGEWFHFDGLIFLSFVDVSLKPWENCLTNNER